MSDLKAIKQLCPVKNQHEILRASLQKRGTSWSNLILAEEAAELAKVAIKRIRAIHTKQECDTLAITDALADIQIVFETAMMALTPDEKSRVPLTRINKIQKLKESLIKEIEDGNQRDMAGS